MDGEHDLFIYSYGGDHNGNDAVSLLTMEVITIIMKTTITGEKRGKKWNEKGEK